MSHSQSISFSKKSFVKLGIGSGLVALTLAYLNFIGPAGTFANLWPEGASTPNAVVGGLTAPGSTSRVGSMSSQRSTATSTTTVDVVVELSSGTRVKAVDKIDNLYGAITSSSITVTDAKGAVVGYSYNSMPITPSGSFIMTSPVIREAFTVPQIRTTFGGTQVGNMYAIPLGR